MSEKKEKISLKRKFDNLYFEERNDLLDKIEQAKTIKDASITYNKLIKDLEELIIEYYQISFKKIKE